MSMHKDRKFAFLNKVLLHFCIVHVVHAEYQSGLYSTQLEFSASFETHKQDRCLSVIALACLSAKTIPKVVDETRFRPKVEKRLALGKFLVDRATAKR